MTLAELRRDHDAVFLGIGLGGVRALEAEGAEKAGVRPAVDFIAELRQADGSRGAAGRAAGGGDRRRHDGDRRRRCRSKKLGAEEVTIVYRRSRERMGASGYEQELATSAGVRIVCDACRWR